jgi:5-methylcytosine-specific restriction protein B
LKKSQDARENSNNNVFLIIDEINRGLLGKIFGELIIDLEYRESQKFELPYSGETVSIPSNLVILGTMNTADRTIALVDYALRRRFFFIDARAMPDQEILRGWLDLHSDLESQQVENIINLFTSINEARAKQALPLIEAGYVEASDYNGVKIFKIPKSRVCRVS